MNRIIYPILLTVMFSIPSFSGITIVRGGGGLGELNAMNLFYKLNFILKSCLSPHNICNLPNSRLQILPKVISEFQNSKPQLHFNPNLNTLFIWDSTYQNLTINQKYLYDPQTGVSRTMNQILSLEIAALFARITNESINQSLEFINSWTPPFFEFSKKIDLDGTPLKFHYTVLYFEKQFSDISLIIEGTSASNLLNNKISLFLGTQKWTVKDYSWQSGYLSFRIEWIPAVSIKNPLNYQSNKTGILVIQPKVIQGNLDINNTSLNLLNVRP